MPAGINNLLGARDARPDVCGKDATTTIQRYLHWPVQHPRVRHDGRRARLPHGHGEKAATAEGDTTCSRQTLVRGTESARLGEIDTAHGGGVRDFDTAS